MDARLEREQAFHDRAFTENSRAKAWRFEAILGQRSAWYEETLRTYALGARALEIGCGPGGNSAFHLAHYGANVVGIDLSPVAIERAIERSHSERNGEQLEFRVMNGERLEFPDNSFDVVCGSGILHHLDIGRAYSEIARVLKVDGIGVFSEPLGHNPAINAYRKRTPEIRTIDEHPLLMNDLALAEGFFAEVSTRFFSLLALAAIPLRDRPGFERILGGLDGLDRWFFRLAPPLRRYAWMVGITLRGPRSTTVSARP